jgi:outer membrane protein OmpA-like peptidoglycan-associated protein
VITPPVDTAATTPPVVVDVPKTPPAKTELQPFKFVISVVDAADQTTPLPAKVKLAGAKDNVIVAFTPMGDGVFEFNVTNTKPKDYRLSVEVEGYIFQNIVLKLEGASTQEKTVNRKIAMRKLMVGVSSILRNIYFDFDKATFKTESYTELNKLEAMLSQSQNTVIEIAGHTDAVGTKAYNKYLSLKRAQAVKDYLTKKGISTKRIKAVGYGKSKPLASNDDEHGGRELNRRVEFKVLQN